LLQPSDLSSSVSLVIISFCYVLVSIIGCDRKVSFGKRRTTNKMSFGGDRAEGPGRRGKMNWQTSVSQGQRICLFELNFAD